MIHQIDERSLREETQERDKKNVFLRRDRYGNPGLITTEMVL
jgi:hypothetical protein